MLKALEDELNKRQALVGPLSPAITAICDAIVANNVPERMKQTIAVSEMMLFASQFRRPIYHWDGTLVPINAISLIIAGSGAGKDSGVNAARACFKPSYNEIEQHRTKLAKAKAIQDAKEAGEPNATEWETYKDYYRAPNPLFTAVSTVEGWLQHLNDLEVEGIGAGYIYSGEFGSELSTNPLMIDNIRALSEMYDIGKKEVKLVKARENQSKEINGMPANAMFMGSQANMLYNEKIKRIIETEITTKIGRRAFTCFCPENVEEDDFNGDVDAMIEAELANEDSAFAIREKVASSVSTICDYHLPKIASTITIDNEVRKLFIIYKRYNSEKSETIPHLFPMAKIVRKHQQWKALKLAGAIAMFRNSDVIEEEDYIYAIRFCELLDQDLRNFEAELVKEPYEVFADYMASEAVDGKASIGLHALRKAKYIPTSGNSDMKMRELCQLANAYNSDGIYSVSGSEIHYEAVIKTDTIGISFKPINNSGINKAIQDKDPNALRTAKELVAKTTAYGLDVQETEFSQLGKMLEGDFAYSPFRFQNGTRGKDYIIGGTKWVVLDVDTSVITAEECHFMLSDINHYIALSSDPNNQFKFRVLIELDSPVQVDGVTWKKFYLAIADELSISVDPVPQSQIFYSYKGRTVYSVLDAAPLEAKPFLVTAQEAVASNPPTSHKKLTNPQKQAMLKDEMTTFAPAFEASSGQGSRKMIWAANLAYKDLGATKEETIALIRRINDYWTYSMPEERLQSTIINQIERW